MRSDESSPSRGAVLVLDAELTASIASVATGLELLGPDALGTDAAAVKLHKIGLRPGEKMEEELITAGEIPRTSCMRRLLVVHPVHAGVLCEDSPIPEALYRSSAASPLDRGAIASLLYECGALVGGGREPQGLRVEGRRGVAAV